jgi:hypothetical protein
MACALGCGSYQNAPKCWIIPSFPFCFCSVPKRSHTDTMCWNDIILVKILYGHRWLEGEQRVRQRNQTSRVTGGTPKDNFLGSTQKRDPYDVCIAAGHYERAPSSNNQWWKTHGAIRLSVGMSSPFDDINNFVYCTIFKFVGRKSHGRPFCPTPTLACSCDFFRLHQRHYLRPPSIKPFTFVYFGNFNSVLYFQKWYVFGCTALLPFAIFYIFSIYNVN